MSLDQNLEPKNLIADAIDAAEDMPDPLAGLAEKTAADPGAPFMSETLEALAALRKDHRAAFEALRSQLKKTGCRVTALDDAIAEENGEAGGRGPTQADILICLAQPAELFWSPVIERFIDRKTGRPATRPHLGRRVISPFLPGLIFVPDFELDHPELCDRTIGDLGDLLRVGECVASLKVEHMAALRKIVDIVNGRRLGRGSRGVAKFKPGDKVYIADGPFRDFAAEVQSLDSRGRLKVFIAALMRGVSATLSETQVEPALGSPSRPNGSTSSQA